MTFAPNDMYDEKYSKLVTNLVQINTSEIKETKLRSIIPKPLVEYNHNKYWILVKIKGLLRSKYLLYYRKNKEITEI